MGPLAEQDGIKELHAVWDSMIFEHTGYANLPYSDADWAEQGKNASDLVAKHASSLPYNVSDMNFINWAHESFEVTETFVYKNIVENNTLPEDYIKAAQIHCEQRIVTAGLRLANFIKTLDLSLRDREPTVTEPFLLNGLP